MTDEEARRVVVRYWLDQAREALASARSEHAAGRGNFAVNRAYYACFYGASAALLGRGRKFVKHSGVRAALHRDLVKPGRIDAEWGRFYDLLFRRRGEADYIALTMFDDAETLELIEKAEGFVAEMERLAAEP
jgi:uncharacterized protein (UPF0332 family)